MCTVCVTWKCTHFHMFCLCKGKLQPFGVCVTSVRFLLLLFFYSRLYSWNPTCIIHECFICASISGTGKASNNKVLTADPLNGKGGAIWWIWIQPSFLESTIDLTLDCLTKLYWGRCIWKMQDNGPQGLELRTFSCFISVATSEIWLRKTLYGFIRNIRKKPCMWFSIL